MNGNKRIGPSIDASRYIRENFQPDDRLAVVLINKRAEAVIQRLASAEKIASPDFLEWIRQRNDQRYEAYLSMNALRPDAQSRTKGEIAAIRHVYLDFDEDGTAAVDALVSRRDVPKPNYLINSSPDKWQVIWTVAGFIKKQAEDLLKNLARECGADAAATDCARVLRIPGFYNHKYATPFLVRAEAIAREIYSPERFPKFAQDERAEREPMEATAKLNGHGQPKGGITQSERDWAYAKRALARGDTPDLVAFAIATYRRYDKSNPQDYAARTVAKAAAAIKAEQSRMVNCEPERT